MKQIISWLTKTNSFNFIIVLTIASILVKIPGTLIGNFLLTSAGLNHPPFSSDQQLAKLTLAFFITAVILAPLFETTIGQYLPFKIIGKFTKSKKLTIILSALIFSLIHLPVIGFLLSAFLVGLIFSWGYVLKTTDKNNKPFVLITISHSIHNLIAFIAAYFMR
jgi:hypothetical protein